MAVNWGQIIAAVAPVVGGYLASRNSRNQAEQAAGGMRFQTVMPQIMEMMTRQQQQSDQSYGYRQREYEANEPLRNSIRSMAMNLTPNHLRTGSGGGGGPLPMPQMPTTTTQQAEPAPLIDSFMDDYSRRGGGTGGIGKGTLTGLGAAGSIAPMTGPAAPFVLAGGALAGAIGGAITKKAKTAPTDFTVQDARKAIANAIKAYQGREPNPGEIDTMITGQGWQPGHRWVGEQSLRYILSQIQQQSGRG